jgi:regulator of sirC expression with transglutaminase-like and TPR domain
VAWDHLERIGEPALPFLEDATRASADVRVRVQSERFLKEWSRREVLHRWVEFCRAGRFDLEDGAFLIAASEYPDLDVALYRKALDNFAGVLRGRLATARTTDEAVKKISSFLFAEVGFQGNVAEYYDPENSYLHRVMDRKKGIPISLATVFLCVARRVSVRVEGVGMPQHFLLKYRSSIFSPRSPQGDAAGEVFIDVFHSGRLLTARNCARFLAEAQIPFRDDYLRAVPDREILSRMLGNLLRIYMEAEDQRRHDRVAAMLKLLA